MGQVEEFGDDDAGLAEDEVFRLQAGEKQVGAFGFDAGGQEAGNTKSVAGTEVVAVDVDGAVCALGEGFADGLPTRSGPALTTTTSPPCFSLSWRASSRA